MSFRTIIPKQENFVLFKHYGTLFKQTKISKKKITYIAIGGQKGHYYQLIY